MNFSQVISELGTKSMVIAKSTSVWTTANPILPEGTVCIEKRTNYSFAIKIADGVNTWSNLKVLSNIEQPVYIHTLMLGLGSDTIHLPFQYNASFANILVFIGGVKYNNSKITYDATNRRTLVLESPVLDDVEVEVYFISTDNHQQYLVSGYNHVIDGDFTFWYENTTQTTIGYGSDTMWQNNHLNSTKLHSRQEFGLGELFPDGVLCPFYYSRTVVTSVAGSGNYVQKKHVIEDVTKLAGKTITISFYAKADTNRNLCVEFQQLFGTGGTPSAQVNTYGRKIALTTQWVKHSITITLPSVVGKTLGTDNNHYTRIVFWFDAGSTYDSRLNTLGQQSGTFDIAKVSLVEGTSLVKPIERTWYEDYLLIARYYQSFGECDSVDNGVYIGLGSWYSTTQFTVNVRLIVPMRVVAPTTIALNLSAFVAWPHIAPNMISYNTDNATKGEVEIIGTIASAIATASRTSLLMPNTTASARLIFDCRL